MKERLVKKTHLPRARGNALVSLMAISVILTVGAYRQILPYPILDDLLLSFLMPIFIILLVFRENPLRYGLGVGNWREGLIWVVGGSILMIGMAWLFWRLPNFQAYYHGLFPATPNPNESFWRGVARSGLYMFGWEFLFRGFLLFALAGWFGPEAIWIQAVPFALAHIGKPEWETYSSIVGGVLSGWVAYRVKSCYPSWLMHWVLAICIHWLVVYGR
jgi:membrane protease YdiL (CAAX protease family)